MSSIRAITVPDSGIPPIRAGYPRVSIEDLGRPEPAMSPGRPLELVTSRGDFVAWALSDPHNGVLRILSTDADDRLDDALLETRARAAIELRRRLGLFPARGVEGEAFRLIHGEGDGLPGFQMDVYGPWVIAYVLARGLRDWGRRLAGAVARVAAEQGVVTAAGEPWPRGVVQKVRARDSARPGKPLQSGVHGEVPPEKFLVRERAASFEIHPLSGLNVGLFTDMREHRRGIGRFCRDARVLNAFAYTGTLGVVAALEGAREVTSVDLSSGVLKWARQNFRHSALDPDRHRFEVSDVFQYLRRAAEGELRFDLIVLDPPTYSAARAGSWSMKNHLPALISKSLALLSPGGILWFSGNAHRLTSQDLDAGIAAGAADSGRQLTLLESGGLPPDYPTPLVFQEGRYLRLRIFRVGS